MLVTSLKTFLRLTKSILKADSVQECSWGADCTKKPVKEGQQIKFEEGNNQNCMLLLSLKGTR